MTLERSALLNNRYRIVNILGQGGMGAVYRALDENLGVEVAVKENLFLTDEYARQFRLEANILAGLRHPNLPRVGDHFVIEGQGQYLVMDFIEGEDLRERMDRLGVLPEEEVILIGAAICDALAYLHSRRPPVVHRDIKPGNVKITPDGHIILVDFGLAKVMYGGQTTTTGARAMTPGYSPPEQYGTARTDPRSDIYSLGATLYAALTGSIPEDGLSRATGNAELTPVRRLNPKVSRRLAAAIEKALALRSDERYQTAEEFKQALLTSSNATRNTTQNNQTVQPPPQGVNGDGDRNLTPPLPIGGPYNEPVQLPKPATRPRPRKTNGCSVILLALLIVIVGLGGIYAYRPALADGVLAWLALGAPQRATGTQPAATPPSTALTDAAPTKTTLPATPAPPSATGTPSPSPTVMPTPSVTSTPVGGGYGQIAFVSDRTGVPQIWLMNSDGAGLQQITSLADGACQPAWSPDGQQLVFISPCPGKRYIYPGASLHIINVDGSNLRSLPMTPEGDFDPSWSSDGKKIAFTSLRDGQMQIYVLDLTDNSVVNISNSSFADAQPVWSPIGMQLAFVRYRTAAQIWLMTDQGTSQIQFSRSGDFDDTAPAWTPDGQVILYSQTNHNGTVPWLMGMRYEDRVNPYKEFRIPANSQPEDGPVATVSVSPDGHWLAFESWPDGFNHDIYIMTITGANRERLTTDPGFDFDPAWRPTPRP